jgi:hypothetical protein
VVAAGEPQAIAEVVVDRLRDRVRNAIAEDLDEEVVVGRGRDIAAKPCGKD